MIATSVHARYARSLAEIVLQQDEENRVGNDLALYGEIFRAVPDALDVFDSPAVPVEAKVKFLDALLARYPVCRTVENFLRVLRDHRRIRQYHRIVEHYLRVLDERKGVVAAHVTAEAPLAPAEREALQERLVRLTGRVVRMDVQTDPEILGGLVVQIGSTVYDGSVRRQLAEMKQRLMH